MSDAWRHKYDTSVEISQPHDSCTHVCTALSYRPSCDATLTYESFVRGKVRAQRQSNLSEIACRNNVFLTVKKSMKTFTILEFEPGSYLGQSEIISLFAVREDDVAEVLVRLSEQLLDPDLLRVVDEVLFVEHQYVRQVASKPVSGMENRILSHQFAQKIFGLIT